MLRDEYVTFEDLTRFRGAIGSMDISTDKSRRRRAQATLSRARVAVGPRIGAECSFIAVADAIPKSETMLPNKLSARADISRGAHSKSPLNLVGGQISPEN